MRIVFHFRRNITIHLRQNEPERDKATKMNCGPSEDSDQPSLIRVFAVHLRKLWSLATHKVHSKDSDQHGHSDWAHDQADLSFRLAHRSFCCFCHAPTKSEDPMVLYRSPECIGYAELEQAWKYMTICCISLHLCRSIRKLCLFVCLFVLRLNVPVNNFSVMSGRSHRFLGN